MQHIYKHAQINKYYNRKLIRSKLEPRMFFRRICQFKLNEKQIRCSLILKHFFHWKEEKNS